MQFGVATNFHRVTDLNGFSCVCLGNGYSASGILHEENGRDQRNHAMNGHAGRQIGRQKPQVGNRQSMKIRLMIAQLAPDWLNVPLKSR